MKHVFALVAMATAALLLTACNDDGDSSQARLPTDAVALVGDRAIAKSEFHKVLKLAKAFTSAEPAAPGHAAYVACSRRTGEPTRSQQQRCRSVAQGLQDRALDFLIQDEWLNREAARHHYRVPTRRIEEIRRYALNRFGGKRLPAAVRIQYDQLLQYELSDGLVRRLTRTPMSELTRYYRRHKDEYRLRRRKDLVAIRLPSRAEATKLKSSIAAGARWTAAVHRASTDSSRKTTSGRIPDYVGGATPWLDSVVLSAHQGAVVGPAHAPTGWWLLRVLRVKPAGQQTFAQAEPKVRVAVESATNAKSGEAFKSHLEQSYRDQTICPKRFHVEHCGQHH